jgi:hypothetical protein
MNIRDTFINLTSKTYPYGHEEKLISFLPNEYQIDPDGNYFYEVGTDNKTIFASHLDTACKEHSVVNHVFDGKLIRTDKTTVLGADDKAGVTVLLYMISQSVPGLYYFFIGEECGCIGSTAASKRKDFFSKFNKIISFDRRGTTSIITHQSSERSCSDDFANSLSKEYSNLDLSLSKDDTGIYTDSAEFTSIIPECTNISVGYYREHTHDEHQDIEFLEKLAKASALVNWESLEISRDPSKIERKYSNYSNYNQYSNHSERGSNDEDYYDYRNGTKKRNRRGCRKIPRYQRVADKKGYGQWPGDDSSYDTSSKISRIYINDLNNEVTDARNLSLNDRHRTDYYKGVRDYYLNDVLSKDELDVIKDQCLDMDDESDRDFAKFMDEKFTNDLIF